MKKILTAVVFLFITTALVAQSNTATVTQTGDENSGIVDQTGFGNTGTITTIGDKNKDDVQKYKSWSYGGSGYMQAKGVTQDGSDNFGTIEQLGSRHQAGIGQKGNENNAEITQNDPTLNAYGQNVAFVDQLGDLNTSIQNQQGRAANSYFRQEGNSNRAEAQQFRNQTGYATVEQVGDNNKSYQYQEYMASYQGGNDAAVKQVGDNNDAKQEQHGINNNASNLQLGNWNITDLTQTGNDNSTVITQENGDYNVVNLTQSDGGDANILQDGFNNTVMGIGTDIMATSLNGSTLDVDQIGNGNTLHLQQTNGASATVMQDGLTNTAVIVQN